MAKSPRKAPSHALDCSRYNHTIIWDSVDQYETIHPLLHQVLCIVKRKLQNGMATMYGGDDPLQEIMSVPGTFCIVPYIENDEVLEEQLQLDSKDQMDAMAMGYTLPDGIYFNYDLVTARPRLIMVRPHTQRNRYRNIELFYAFRDSEGLLHLDEQTQYKSLGMLEMYPYFRYFPYHAMWLALV